MMSLKDYVLHQFREMKREVLKALDGLSPEDLTSHEPGGHSPIAWIVQHCCLNVDLFFPRGLTGEFLLDHEEWMLAWPLIDPEPGHAYPPLPELVDRWTRVCDATVAMLQDLPEKQLHVPTQRHPGEPLIETCLRVINHQNVHARQIWMVRGLRGIADPWPTQETWMA